MDVITFPENRSTTSGVQILLHGVISLPDATSYDNNYYRIVDYYSIFDYISCFVVFWFRENVLLFYGGKSSDKRSEMQFYEP